MVGWEKAEWLGGVNMIETKDLLLDKGKIDEWKSMYENVWKHEETAKYLMWESKTIRLPHQIFHAILTLPCPT